jgi:thiamine-phosphate pyrophosphorylase
MEVIVFSSNDKSISEVKEVIELFKHGLETFHLRKPKFSKLQTAEYLNAIPSEYHNRIVLHHFHSLRKKYNIKGVHITREQRKKQYRSKFKLFKLKLSLRGKTTSRSISKIESLDENLKQFDYIFLTPVFNSISQNGHSGHFGERSITKYLKLSTTKVYALGGVKIDNVEASFEMGFTGIALLGSIWNNESDSLAVFKEIQKKISNINR